MTDSDTGLIDVHAHFLTDGYRAAAVAAGHRAPDGMPEWPQWTEEAHLELMDRHRIDRAVLSISSPGVHFGEDRAARDLAREVNTEAAAIAARHPDRFGFFGALPLPDVAGAIAEARFALDECGAAGVAVLSNSGGRYLGDAGFDPLWAELDRRAAVVFVHPTSPPAAAEVALGQPRPMIEFLFDSARTVVHLVLAGVIERFPAIRFVVTHCGGVLPLLADRVQLFRLALDGPDAAATGVVDQLRSLWFDLAGTPLPRQLPALTSVVGEDRIVYGSDHCWTPPLGVAFQVAAIDHAPDDWRGITTRNVAALLDHRGVESHQ